MNQSETITKITEALVAAQAELGSAKKDGKNNGFNSKYATLESVIESSREILVKNKLAVVQSPVASPQHLGGAWLETKILHVSGEWLSSVIFIPDGRNNAHGYGSAYTYARRFALCAMLGIIQEDDDGNDAVIPESAKKTIRTIPPKAEEKLPNDILDELIALEFTDKQIEASRLRYYNPPEWPELREKIEAEKKKANG